MDKYWMSKDRVSREYEDGVDQFLQFAIYHSDDRNYIRCPCQTCGNLIVHSPLVIRDHLFRRGIDQGYSIWKWYDEECDVTKGPICPKTRFKQTPKSKLEFVANNVEMVQVAYEDCTDEPNCFKTLLEDAEKPLYSGCSTYIRLSTVMTLYNIKGRYGWSDSSFSDLLSSHSDMFPSENDLPSSIYEVNKMLTAMGLDYLKIHACPNDCILYRKEYNNLFACPTCGLSRWKKNKNHIVTKIPAKFLRYFPPIQGFKRMFYSSETAKKLVWHARERKVDGKLCHPADAPHGIWLIKCGLILPKSLKIFD